LQLVNLPAILLLRHFGDVPKLVEHLTLNGSGVAIDVSCCEKDRFMPFDRVVTPRGHATIVGKENELLWLKTDDASALGAGAGTFRDPSQFKLVRRIGFPAVLDNEISVSSVDFKDLKILPDDEIITNGSKFVVVGMNAEKKVVVRVVGSEVTQTFAPAAFADCQIVYRADLPANRIYDSKAGTGLNLSVSLRDFVGKRFIPDDVIETPKGLGLVVGMSDANVAIHLIGDDGVSFFTPQAIYDASLFNLKQRRAIASVFVRRESG
jgi:hypothetical protein